MELEKTINEYRELGKVEWLRDYDVALSQSAEQQKPILMLFQEIPGCSTCVNFGRDVLSHPLMVDTIEEYFIPLAIYNNKPGRDSEILKKYNEPSWNNPVAYFIDDHGKSIIPKLSNNYHPFSMYNKIVEMLIKQHGKLPEYFKLFGFDLKMDYGYANKAYYETPCFWSGETTLASQDAIMSTRAGFIGHKEVVEIFYDPKAVDITILNDYALKEGFFLVEGHFSVDKVPQYYLEKTAFKYLPLTRAQRTSINRALPYKDGPEKFLSPQQLHWLNNNELALKSSADMYKSDIMEGWERLKRSL